MAKTKEELIEIKEELKSLNSKLKELTEDELKEITGGADFSANFSKSIIIGQAIKEKLTPYDEYDRHQN